MENEVVDIIADIMSILNRGDDFEEKYQRHLQILKNGNAHKKHIKNVKKQLHQTFSYK